MSGLTPKEGRVLARLALVSLCFYKSVVDRYTEVRVGDIGCCVVA